MNRLEVVDVAVRLVEVAVAVRVVAVPDVELREVGLDLGRGLPGGHLRVVPGVDRVVDEAPGLRADDVAAVVPPVVGGVVGHGDPVGHLAVDGVAVRALLRVEVAHRDVTGGLGEEHVDVVGGAEVGRPDRRVVDAPVRRRDLVVDRTGDAALEDAERRVRLPELPEDGEDRVLALPGQLDVLTLGDLGRLGVLADLAGQLHLLAERPLLRLLVGAGVGQVVLGRFGLVPEPARRRRGRRLLARDGSKAGPEGHDHRQHSGEECEEELLHGAPWDVRSPDEQRQSRTDTR